MTIGSFIIDFRKEKIIEIKTNITTIFIEFIAATMVMFRDNDLLLLRMYMIDDSFTPKCTIGVLIGVHARRLRASYFDVDQRSSERLYVTQRECM